MKRLLVTGANGFTGRHLIAAAQQSGYVVSPLRSDLTKVEDIDRELQSVDPTHVVHLAAISSVSHTDQEEFYRVNLIGTLNLLHAIRKLCFRPDKILLASSANVYGNARAGRISELVAPRPTNHYAMSKLAMELMTANFVEELPLVTLRPFNYTGRGHDTRFVIPKIIECFKTNQPKIELGNLEVYREYNDVRMVCKAFLRLLQMGQIGETYNICTGKGYSLVDVISRVERMAGRSIEVQVNPQFARPNEVKTLIGDPTKLESTIGELDKYSLDNTLKWMFDQ